MSIGASFPFDLLHAEIVKYCQEQEEKQKLAKAEFLKLAEKSVEPMKADDISHLLHQAFAHNNAETKIESLGYRVGYVLSEKVSKEMGRMSTEIEVVKFICKEFWSAAFGKQVDNLRTNHQGVYVVQDNKMCVLAAFSEGTQFLKSVGIYLALPSGIVRGALANLGIQAVVTPSVEILPSVKFHIQIQPKS